MTNHIDPIRLLTTELDTLSATSAGRRVLQRIELGGLDTLGASTPSELAHVIEWNPRTEGRCHATLAALVPLTALDHEIAIIVMAALRRPLRDMWLSSVRFGGNPDDGAELLAGLWRALAQYKDGDVERILELAFVQSRRSLRRIQRHNAGQESLEGLDFADGGPNPEDLTDNLLGHLTAQGIVSRKDADLIRVTRMEGVPVCDIAESLNLSYKTTHQRRRRAEAAIAHFLVKNPGLV
jgi:DNA-directed RNA polymerase specialized sigma24 family protein